MSNVGKSAFLNGNKLGKGSQRFYWNSGIDLVANVEILYFATYLFHHARAFVTQGKRHLVVLDQTYASFEVQNIDRVDCCSLYSDQYFVFLYGRDRDVTYLDLYLFTISLSGRPSWLVHHLNKKFVFFSHGTCLFDGKSCN